MMWRGYRPGGREIRQRKGTVLMRRQLLALLVVFMALAVAPGLAAADPALEVLSPLEGETIQGTDVTIEFEASDFSVVPSTVPLGKAGQRPDANREGEGHVHFMLDLMPVVVWESTDPYTLTGVPPGEHVLTVELVNNDHSPLSSPISQQIRFSTNSDQLLARTGRPDHAGGDTAVVIAVLLGAVAIGSGLVLRRTAA